MPISSAETIPNFPLNGSELGQYVVGLVSQELNRRGFNGALGSLVVSALTAALANDWVFKSTCMWPGVSFLIACQCHAVGGRFAFTLDPIFSFPNNPAFTEHRPFVRRPVGVAAPPCDWRHDDEHVIDCFTISATVDNPNLVRVHCGMSVVIQNKVPPKHGELFAKIEDHAITYDLKDYPELPPPTVIEQTAEFARAWGIEFTPVEAGSSAPVAIGGTSNSSGSSSPSESSGEGEDAGLAREASAIGEESPAQDVSSEANRLMQERREAKRRDRRAGK